MVISLSRRHRFILGKSTSLAITSLFVSLGLAALDTIWSVYIYSFVNNVPLVGFIVAVLTIVSVLFYFFSTSFVKKYSKTNLWFFGAAGLIVGYILFYFVNTFSFFIASALIWVISKALQWETFGILYRDLSKKSRLGESEGLKYAVTNIGWLLGPLIAGFVMNRLGFKPVFLLAALFTFIAIIIIKQNDIKSVDHHHTKDEMTLKGSLNDLKQFFSNKDLVKSYFIAGGISLYWGIIFVYLPLFIIRSGLPSYWIGLFLFGVALPLVLLEYPLGKVSDKKGFKIFFIAGYLILAIFSFLAFLMTNMYVIFLLFFIASVGASFLEATREAHFFTIIKQSDEEKYYGPYATNYDVFSSIGKLLAAVMLLILPQNYIFLLLSVEMLFFLGVSCTVKK